MSHVAFVLYDRNTKDIRGRDRVLSFTVHRSMKNGSTATLVHVETKEETSLLYYTSREKAYVYASE